MKKTLRWILAVWALLAVIGICIGGTASENLETEEQAGEGLATMQVHFMDVGQGDATLILCGTDAMLIDAGNNDQGTKIQRYLQKQGVDKLRYVICTHPDADHIGGMDVILYKFDCETVLMTDREADTNVYRDVADTMKTKGYTRTMPLAGQSYALGDAEFTIVAPVSECSDNNNNSIAILLTHGRNRFLFTGDAEEEEEKAMLGSGLSLEADVYKAGHHGSRTSSSKELLEAVLPVYAVISCGEENSYGHPHSEVLNNFRAMGIQVFRTDEQGSIIAYSDGNGLTWNCSPSETWQAGEPMGILGQSGPGQIIESETKDAIPEGAVPKDSIPKENISEDVIPEDAVPKDDILNDSVQNDVILQDAIPSGEIMPDSISDDSVTYICNINTKKFHRPDCPSVQKMKESNRMPVNATREELINQGYAPCKNCNP